MDQKPLEVTNINNNINIYGQIAIEGAAEKSLNKKTIKKPSSTMSKAKSVKTPATTSFGKSGIGSGIKNIKTFIETK